MSALDLTKPIAWFCEETGEKVPTTIAADYPLKRRAGDDMWCGVIVPRRVDPEGFFSENGIVVSENGDIGAEKGIKHWKFGGNMWTVINLMTEDEKVAKVRKALANFDQKQVEDNPLYGAWA